MAYDEEKTIHEKCVVLFPSGGLGEGLLGDDETGGPRFVTSCTTHFTTGDGDRDYTTSPQMCHSFINTLHILYDTFDWTDVVVVDRIQGATRKKIIGGSVNDEEAVFYLQYLMDHELFKDSFLEHDAKVALKERMMIRNISKLPANQNMFAIIATRALWEGYQIKIPRRMCNLVEDGICPDVAYILAHYIHKQDGHYVNSKLQSSGHTALHADSFSINSAKHYVRHNPTILAHGNNLECAYSSNTYNIKSLFSDAYISPYGNTKLVEGDTLLVKYFSKNTKYEINELKEFEACLYE